MLLFLNFERRAAGLQRPILKCNRRSKKGEHAVAGKVLYASAIPVDSRCRQARHTAHQGEGRFLTALLNECRVLTRSVIKTVICLCSLWWLSAMALLAARRSLPRHCDQPGLSAVHAVGAVASIFCIPRYEHGACHDSFREQLNRDGIRFSRHRGLGS